MEIDPIVAMINIIKGFSLFILAGCSLPYTLYFVNMIKMKIKMINIDILSPLFKGYLLIFADRYPAKKILLVIIYCHRQ